MIFSRDEDQWLALVEAGPRRRPGGQLHPDRYKCPFVFQILQAQPIYVALGDSRPQTFVRTVWASRSPASIARQGKPVDMNKKVIQVVDLDGGAEQKLAN